MSFSKNDLEIIKSKILLSDELRKKVNVIKKGNDYWCCCPFHEEKTPSCKINDDFGSYYCFGCGAKGDIFTIYTELYNYTFPDAVKELAQKVGIKLTEDNFKQNKKNENIFRILEISTNWFQTNLHNNENCKLYLKKRSISEKTINDFKIGYSFNSKSSLYMFLKEQNFSDDDIIKSNLVKIDNNKKIKDFFYKRLIFPIANEQNKIVGFGGRVLDNSMPKYINSPESFFFKKRGILYNLNQAKQNIRSKKNILICEGYMDVISLYEKNIKTAVAPLGTALTETQLSLAWKYANKPTIMFDGDLSGVKASYKSALMALKYLSPNKYLQFIKLPLNYDPDSYINQFSYNNFITILKKPISIIDFIFEQSSSSIDLSQADNKISYDKYIDDLIETIENKKIKYFYKNEFKKLFYSKIKQKNKSSINSQNKLPTQPLFEKQIDSFVLSYLNHISIRDDLFSLLNESNLLDKSKLEFLRFFQNSKYKTFLFKDLKNLNLPKSIEETLSKINNNSVLSLFPYSKNENNSLESLNEIKESIENLNTRLLNLKKINKSLNDLDNNLTSLTWEDLRKITSDFHFSDE